MNTDASMPIVAIGDVHGVDLWKDVVDNHPHCRIVFLGDYLDPYVYIPNSALIDNLCQIIELKKQRPDEIVLLLGNHDVHYFCNEAPMGSRFNYEIAAKAAGIFRENRSLFCFAYQEGKKIFTHAGIARQWWTDVFCGDDSKPVAEQLNNPPEEKAAAIYEVGYPRGGRFGTTGGILWADISELDDPLPGYIQIVGHNQVPQVTERAGRDGAKIVFCDCLRHGYYLYIDE